MRLGLGLALTQSRPTSGGGGGRPEWVPEGANIHIDLVGGDPQGRAWVDGSGEVAVNTLLGNDPGTEAAFGVSGYEPDLLEEAGYKLTQFGDTQYLAFIGDAKNAQLSGATIVLTFISGAIPELEFKRLNYYQITADGSNGVGVKSVVANNANNGLVLENFGTGDPVSVQDQGAFTEQVVQKVAFTIKENSCVASANGRPVITQDTTLEGWPFDTVLFDANDDFFHLQAITIYPVQADAALPPLSSIA